MSGFTDAWHAMCRLIEEHGCQAVDGPVLCRNGVVKTGADRPSAV